MITVKNGVVNNLSGLPIRLKDRQGGVLLSELLGVFLNVLPGNALTMTDCQLAKSAMATLLVTSSAKTDIKMSDVAYGWLKTKLEEFGPAWLGIHAVCVYDALHDIVDDNSKPE